MFSFTSRICDGRYSALREILKKVGYDAENFSIKVDQCNQREMKKENTILPECLKLTETEQVHKLKHKCVQIAGPNHPSQFSYDEPASKKLESCRITSEESTQEDEITLAVDDEIDLPVPGEPTRRSECSASTPVACQIHTHNFKKITIFLKDII